MIKLQQVSLPLSQKSLRGKLKYLYFTIPAKLIFIRSHLSRSDDNPLAVDVADEFVADTEADFETPMQDEPLQEEPRTLVDAPVVRQPKDTKGRVKRSTRR